MYITLDKCYYAILITVTDVSDCNRGENIATLVSVILLNTVTDDCLHINLLWTNM